METTLWRILGWTSKEEPRSQCITIKDNALCEGTPFVFQLAAAYLRTGFRLLYISTETCWYSVYLSLKKMGIQLDSATMIKRILFVDCVPTSSGTKEESALPRCFYKYVSLEDCSERNLIYQVITLIQECVSNEETEKLVSLGIVVDSASTIPFLSNDVNSPSLLFRYLRSVAWNPKIGTYAIVQRVHQDMDQTKLLLETTFHQAVQCTLEALPFGRSLQQEGHLRVEQFAQPTKEILYKIQENQIKFFTV
eukprot:jgi/Galph1/453/GphlegSOOS_G5210.1